MKNLTKSLCKVAEQELHGKLSKKPKKKGQEEVAKVSKPTRQDSTSKIV